MISLILSLCSCGRCSKDCGVIIALWSGSTSVFALMIVWFKVEKLAYHSPVKEKVTSRLLRLDNFLGLAGCSWSISFLKVPFLMLIYTFIFSKNFSLDVFFEAFFAAFFDLSGMLRIKWRIDNDFDELLYINLLERFDKSTISKSWRKFSQSIFSHILYPDERNS